MVKRRKFLIGMGSLAAGSAAAVGTGAVEKMHTGDRAVFVGPNSDDTAYFRISPGSNGETDMSQEGEIRPKLLELNPDAVTVIDDVYRIHNSRDERMHVWVEDDLKGIRHLRTENNDNIEGYGDRVGLDPGETLNVALKVDGTDDELDLDLQNYGDDGSVSYSFQIRYEEA